MSKEPEIIAIANQKGGVGKTTTSINLAAALTEKGKNVLLIDMDPQGNASTGLGVLHEARKLTTYDILLGGKTVKEAIHDTSTDRLKIIPANSDLTSADIELAKVYDRTTIIKKALYDARKQNVDFDYIFFDCPPSLNLLTINAFVAAHCVIVPLQSEFYALEGLSQLILSIREIRSTANPNLRIEGVVLTMFDRRNNLSEQVEKDAREHLGDLVFKTVIPRNVRLSEAPSYALSVLSYDTHSKGSAAYRALAQELLSKTALKD